MRWLRNLPLLVVLMGIGAVAMYVPAIHALSQRDHGVSRAFFYAGSLFLVLALMIGVATANRHPRNLARRNLAALLAAYLLLPLMLAFPIVEAVHDTSFVNAWFEMVSCLTTTGATLYDTPGRLPMSVHLWRALVGWMGGFLTLLSAIAVMAPLNLGGFEVITGGAVGRDVKGVTQIDRVADSSERVRRYAAQLFPIYGGLTVLLWIGLFLAGDDNIVALSHAMATMATSGISPVGGMAGAKSGVVGEMLIFLFLLFALSRHAMPGRHHFDRRAKLTRDPEFRFGIALVVLVAGFLFLRHWTAAFESNDPDNVLSALNALWANVFTVLSFLSTAGFEATGWDGAQEWSGLHAPGLTLVGLALIGGGVATTAGGVKLLRFYALFKHSLREMEKLVHPHSIGGSGVVARRLRKQGAYVAWVFFMLFGISVTLVMAALTLTGLKFEPALIFSVASLSTTGPLAQIATETPLRYAELGTLAKMILAGAMVLGRLETLAMIALLIPNSWRS